VGLGCGISSSVQKLSAGHSWLRTLLGATVLLYSWPASSQNYIGAERCKTCHEFEYQVWAAGPHARSYQALSQQDRHDPKCATCHTTSPTGDEARLAGVQCERCHGGGKYYQQSFVMKDKELSRAVGLIDPTAKHCQQCHTEGVPSIVPFDFARAWARIDHGKKARELWEQSHSATSKQAPAQTP
jgi:hypothetical protein